MRRYEQLARDVTESVPARFTSRLSTFKDRLKEDFADVFNFFRPLDRSKDERKTLLISKKFHNAAATKKVHGDGVTIETYRATNDPAFRELVHVAMMLRGDLREASSSYVESLSVSKAAVSSVVPNNLFLFLSILLGNESMSSGNVDHDEDPEESPRDTEIFSVAQDLFYLASNRRKLPPKHVGLGVALYKKTRSRKMIDMFHKAGHVPGYEQCHKMSSAMGETILKSLDVKTGKQNISTSTVLHIRT